MKKITIIEPSVATAVTKKRRVAAYCRVSTGMDDQLVSLETQKEHYESYISSNPEWEYAGLYYDEGISGTKKEKRPALLQMIADCEDGKIDYIITKSLSRFARNTTDCLELVRKLLELGIAVYFEIEYLDTGSMESELLLSIMSSLAESESVSILENNKWSIRHRFENGSFKLSYAPYGYSAKDGKLSINEDEAEWIRYIFAETLNGSSANKIAKALNKKQVPVRRGKRWYASTIHNILQNEKYIGDCLLQKTYTDYRFHRHENRGDRDQFYIKDHHKAIISREDFEAAGRMIRQHAKEKNVICGDPKYHNSYPFTQKIICGECGTNFKRKINTTTSGKYAVWSCRTHLEHKENCSMKYVRESVIEDAFCTMMNKLTFARKEILQRLLDDIRDQTHKASLHRINEIDEALEGLTDQRQKLTTIMTKGYIDPASYTKEINDLQAEAAALMYERDRLTKEVNGDLKKTEALREILKYTGKGEMLSEFDGELFGSFVDHITICTRDEIIFHMRCGLDLHERIG